MVKYILLATLLLSRCLPALAQLLWQQPTGTAPLNEFSSALVAVPGGFLHVGQGGGDGTAANLPNHLYLAKLSPAGAVLWQKSPSFVNRNAKVLYPIGASADANGEFYVACQAFPLIATSSGNPSFGLLVKCNAVGDTLWTKVLPGLIGSDYAHIVTTSDGGGVVIGDEGADAFIAKFSSSGQELWRRTYAYSSAHPGYLDNLTLLANGGFLVAQSPNYGGLPWQYLVLDAQGLLVATRPARRYGHYYMNLDHSAANVLAGAGRLYVVAPSGDTLWSRAYAQYGRPVDVRLAIETPGGQYLVGGARYNSNDYDLSLLLVDKATGAVLRDTVLVRYGSDELVTGLHCDAQGNYVVGLSILANGPLGKADQYTFLLRGWSRYLPTRAAPALASRYTAYPNPAGAAEPILVADGQGHAYAGPYEVRDMTGRLVLSGPTLPAGGLPTQVLAPGLYLLRPQVQGVWQAGLPLLVR